MDCKTARLLIDFARPWAPELPRTETDALDLHLAACSECDALARAERQADEHLAPVMRDVPVPAGLRDRVLARLQAERGDRQRRWLAWGARSGLAAAAVLLLAWLGFSLWARPRVQVDLEAIVQTQQSCDREDVEKWFRERHGVSVSAPSGFNYAFLTHCNLEECPGQQPPGAERVPWMQFIRGGTRAEVYVLTDKRFDLAPLVGRQEDSGGRKVEVWRHPTDPHQAYLILYTGESLQPVLNADDQPAL